MMLEARMRKLEAKATRTVPPPQPQHFDEEQWLELFAGWGHHFKHEPDYDRAVDLLRDVITKAKSQSDPPWEPPDDFHPDAPRWRRLECWRWKNRFPEVVEALAWLKEMRQRLENNIPPVSEAE